jgi:geranylgeranyl diphosphate synthase, type II
MQLPLTRDRLPVELDEPTTRPRALRAADEPVATVASALDELLQRGTRHGWSLDAGYRRLWAQLAAATENGKRLRPALLDTAYRAWGGTDRTAVSMVGAAIELLHTAFVIHDDVIDGDDCRRGRPNISGTHTADARSRGVDAARARDFGNAAGILAGDLALTTALRAVATCPLPTVTVHRLLDLFDAALHATAAGELADVRLSLGADAVSVEATLTMAERKTAVYSFALPLQAAAVLADVPEHTVAAAGTVGRLLGTSFQLVDDLLGVFGDPAETGKSVLSDLRAGKQTSLIVHARNTGAWPEMAPYIGDPSITEAEGARVRDLLDACGSREFVRGLAAGRAQEALQLSEDSGLPPGLVSWLRSTTRDLLGRAA